MGPRISQCLESWFASLNPQLHCVFTHVRSKTCQGPCHPESIFQEETAHLDSWHCSCETIWSNPEMARGELWLEAFVSFTGATVNICSSGNKLEA